MCDLGIFSAISVLLTMENSDDFKSGFQMGHGHCHYTSKFLTCHFLLDINCNRGRILPNVHSAIFIFMFFGGSSNSLPPRRHFAQGCTFWGSRKQIFTFSPHFRQNSQIFRQKTPLKRPATPLEVGWWIGKSTRLPQIKIWG